MHSAIQMRYFHIAFLGKSLTCCLEIEILTFTLPSLITLLCSVQLFKIMHPVQFLFLLIFSILGKKMGR